MAYLLFKDEVKATALKSRLDGQFGYPDRMTRTYTEVRPAKIGDGFLVKILDEDGDKITAAESSLIDNTEATRERFRRQVNR